MAKIYSKTIIDAPLKEVWDAHADPYFYRKSMPKWCPLIISKVSRFGQYGELNFLAGPFVGIFKSKILFFEEYNHFIDCAQKLPWPFNYWVHKHDFIPISDNKTALVETIIYGVKYSWMNRVANFYLKKLFNARQEKIKKLFKKSSQNK